MYFCSIIKTGHKVGNNCLRTPLARGLSIALPYSLTGPQMLRALNETDVTIVIGVPRLYCALAEGIITRAESSGWIAKAGFQFALFESPRLKEPLEIVGAPVVHLDLDCDQPVGMIAAR